MSWRDGPSLAELYDRAGRETAAEPAGDFDARRSVRYRALLREHGHLVPGPPEPLPCGWPTTRKERDDGDTAGY